MEPQHHVKPQDDSMLCPGPGEVETGRLLGQSVSCSSGQAPPRLSSDLHHLRMLPHTLEGEPNHLNIPPGSPSAPEMALYKGVLVACASPFWVFFFNLKILRHHFLRLTFPKCFWSPYILVIFLFIFFTSMTCFQHYFFFSFLVSLF